jgi:hypothetical protein
MVRGLHDHIVILELVYRVHCPRSPELLYPTTRRVALDSIRSLVAAFCLWQDESTVSNANALQFAKVEAATNMMRKAEGEAHTSYLYVEGSSVDLRSQGWGAWLALTLPCP